MSAAHAVLVSLYFISPRGAARIPLHMPVLRPVSYTSPMCFPKGGHVSCCATLTDWATDSSAPVRVDFKLALLVYKALHDATAAYLVDDCQLVSHAGSDQPTSTRAAFRGPTHGSVTGASQPLDHSSGTVCQPGFASPTTTSENFVGSWSHFRLIDTAAHSDYCSYAPVKYSYSLTQTLTHS